MNEEKVAKTQDVVSAQVIGELINVAGRQRMLSQRIVLHVLLACHGDASALAVARESLATFAGAHAGLVDGNARLPGAFSDALRSLYFGKLGADERIRRFIDDADAAIESIVAGAMQTGGQPSAGTGRVAIDALIAQATPLLELLQQITLAYQNEMRGVEQAASKRSAELADRLSHISMQANIVAINARISAGRAGPYGREFAVVTSLLAEIVKEMDGMIQSVLGSREARRAASQSR